MRMRVEKRCIEKQNRPKKDGERKCRQQKERVQA
jgi:hypothetical protein